MSSKITLQNLFEFANSSYKIDYNYKYNLSEEIKKIKEQNINEKSSMINYHFIELNYFHKNPNEEMVFLFPINSNNKWFHIINCFLIVNEKNYINKNNYERINLINSYFEKLNNNKNDTINYNNFIKNYKYNLIIIKENNIEIFDNGYDIYIIIISYDEEYYLIFNLLNKYYSKNSNIVEYFIRNNKNLQNTKNEKDQYLELQTNDECELSITELENNVLNISKQSKDIFIPHKNTSNTENNINKSNTSTNNKKDLIKSAKISLSIKQLQDIASELNIPLTSGNLKNGNPKYRTKAELFEDIKNYKI